jgi:hypothetical protein
MRTDSLYLGSTGIRVSQLLAGVSCVAALVLLAVYLRRKNPPLYVDQRAAKLAAEAETEQTEEAS